jgi:sec-independent protein translocase protein TatA
MPSGSEWIIVLILVLVIFGGTQLPKLARNLGRAQKDFKEGLAEAEASTTKPALPVALEEDSHKPRTATPTE